ncbi:MAG: 3-deoxy-D-manno-octulosonic acid transferase [Gammaproteobacteria bacterium]|nr:MAG: 3-deoxy-D-manno-octulosonic acid transferase [Gammaproteobacteria bacterium]
MASPMKRKCLWLFYNMIMTVGLPLAVVRLLWKSRNNADYRKRLPERFARGLPQGPIDIWIHAVSVGEFLAVQPLVEALLKKSYTLLVTTTTPTGSNMVTERLGHRVKHCYLPFDAPWLVKTFLKTTQPQAAVFVETEIWPNYVKNLNKRDIPTLLINARLSDKSYRGYARLGAFAKETIASFDTVACQDESSQKRFQALGTKAITVGNIKFDLPIPTDLLSKQLYLKRRLGQHPFVLIASTHKGEDEVILRAFQNSSYANTHRLVIAPRHPERSREVMTICQSNNVSALYYSQDSKIPATNKHVLIVDTLGELLYFYALADFAVIGGSFVPHGGHNPLEAALFATPCLIGEYYFNFDSLINKMKDKNAIIVTPIEQLFNSRSELSIIGQNAKHFLSENQGAISRYLQLIEQSMPTAT